jgi:hypothetical protein
MAKDDDKVITGMGGPEAAEPQPQPDNVVTDNTGVVPVQPVSTSDPTIDDNTNPKVAFDGADPRNIPPHDSNEQLHIAAAKRFGADMSDLTTAASKRREAVTAAYDNSRDVREVVGEDDSSAEANSEVAKAAQERVEQAKGGARAQPPQGRSATKPGQVKA